MRSNELFLLAANSGLETAQEEERFDWLFSRGAQRLTGASTKRLPLLSSSPVNQLAFLEGRKLASQRAPPLPGLACGEAMGRRGCESAAWAGPRYPA